MSKKFKLILPLAILIGGVTVGNKIIADEIEETEQVMKIEQVVGDDDMKTSSFSNIIINQEDLENYKIQAKFGDQSDISMAYGDQNNYTEGPTEKELLEQKVEDMVVKSMMQIMDYYQEGKIVFNEKILNALRAYWKGEYLKFEKSTRGIIERRDKYKEALEEVFKDVGVPVEFLNVACTESRFSIGPKSKKNAGGYYQFLEATGRHYGLTINDKVDERNDPVKSGKACAKYLKDLYADYGDWSLVLARYNGKTFPKRYYDSQAGKDLSYGGYLKHREQRVNSIRESIQNGAPVDYRVKDGNSLWSIALKYKVKPADIVKENNLESDKIHPNQILKIPVLDQTHAEHVFAVEMSDTIENMRYPEKFYGFMDAEKELIKRDSDMYASVENE